MWDGQQLLHSACSTSHNMHISVHDCATLLQLTGQYIGFLQYEDYEELEEED